MPFLFLVTILLSGGAWCSQLCYFGAWDSLAAGKNGKREVPSSKTRSRTRWTVLFVFIGVASALRGFGVPVIYSTGIAAFAGMVGIMVIGFVSKRRHVAMHCSSYCPGERGVANSVISGRGIVWQREKMENGKFLLLK